MTEMDLGPASTTEEAVPQIHDAYYKARKLFIIFSLLLLSNELVGFKISKVNFIGIEAEIKLKNPEALIWGYLILWAYSAIRFAIEWFQIDSNRRKFRTSKWDLWVTISVAIVAFTVLVTQQIENFQLAKAPLEFLLPFFVGLTLPLIFNFWERSKQDMFTKKRQKRYKMIFIVLCITAPVLTLVYFILFINNISLIAILALLSGFIIGMWKNSLDGRFPFTASPDTKEEGTVAEASKS
jgi:hypothetical protein